jgi:hypothetical protein
VAVANARENLKREAGYVCRRSHGLGVAEAIDLFVIQ